MPNTRFKPALLTCLALSWSMGQSSGQAVARDASHGAIRPAIVRTDPCRKKEGLVRMKLVPDKEANTVVEMNPDLGLGVAKLLAELDLDGRAGRDWKVWFPATQGSGGTMQALFIHCHEDQYSLVWGPEYAFALEVLDSSSRGWRHVNRVIDGGIPGSPGTETFRMHFRNGKYRDERRRTDRWRCPKISRRQGRHIAHEVLRSSQHRETTH
jgi:hypothetical protein